MTGSDLIPKYLNKGVLLDANLLVLLAVGLYRRDRIRTHKRTKAFTVDDFELLHDLANRFNRRFTTPNILTEADNLARQIDEREHVAIAEILKQIIGTMLEICVPAQLTSTHARYAELGLTDTVTIVVSERRDSSTLPNAAPFLPADQPLVITNNVKLWNWLTKAGKDAINFNHLRTIY